MHDKKFGIREKASNEDTDTEFLLHNENLKVPIEKVWIYGFIKKDTSELHLRMTNARDLVRIFFYRLVGDSHQVRTVITVKRLMVFTCFLVYTR